MKRSKAAAYVVGLALVAVLVGGSVWLLAQPNRVAGPGGRPGNFTVPVEAQKVRIGVAKQEAEAIGTLRSWESVVIKPEVTGRIVKIAFEEGAVVKKGDVLVQLDTAEAEAEVMRSRAAVSLAKENYERAVQLRERGAGTVANLDRAQADLATAEATLKLAEAKLAKLTLTAPFDGVIGLRKVSVGALLIPGQDIVNLEQINPLKVDFKVPETLIAAVRVGQPISLRLDSIGSQVVPGAVYAIDPLLETGGRAIVLRARIPNPDGVLRPGLFARVVLTIAEKPNAIFVPEQAILPASDGTVSVFRVKDGKVEMAKVKLGDRIKGEVEVAEGLTAGDVIVTAGLPKLRDGVSVCLLASRQGAPPAAGKDGGSEPAAAAELPGIAPCPGPGAPARGQRSARD